MKFHSICDKLREHNLILNNWRSEYKLKEFVCCGADKIAHSANKREQFLSHHNEHHRESLHIYTDAAGRKGDSVSCSAVSNNCRSKCERLNCNLTIQEAELKGIILALSLIEKSRFDAFTILTDSFFNLNMLKEEVSRHKDNRDVAFVRNEKNRLSKIGKKVCLCYVPAHCGIEGNEKADKAAKSYL